jgi:hypothetical protein
MSSIYYPAADPGDHETCLIRDTVSPHHHFGAHIGFLTAGMPGAGKEDYAFRPLFHLTLPDEGKVEADVTWAKLWLYVLSKTGNPQTLNHYLYRCTRYDWYDYYSHGDDEAEYTCYQHSGAAWTAAWGDAATPLTTFYGPSATGWISVTCTDHIKDAITSRTRDINLLLTGGNTAGNGWNFACKHDGTYPWYVEAEWAAPAGVPAGPAAAAQVF